MLTKQTISSTLISGSKFMLLARMIIKMIGMCSSLVLARLLMPEDFGLVAIGMAFLVFIDLFGQFGFSTVLIQKQDATKDDYDTAWTFRVLFGVFTTIILLLTAPYAASFYGDNRITNVVYALALIAFLGGWQNIYIVNFQKNFEFKKELWSQVIPKIFTFLVTVGLAFYLRNYWALIIGMIFNQIVNVALSFVMYPYIPRMTLVSFKGLFRFSKWLMLNNVVFYLNNRLTELILGKYLSASATGLFSLSNEIASLPVTELAAPINKASFPVYAQAASDRSALKTAYLFTISLSALLSIPASCGLYLIADCFVEVVLGDKWLAAAPLMKMIALSSLLYGLSTNNGFIFLATGKPHITFGLNLFRVIVLIPAFIVAISIYGLVGAGYAMVLASALTLFASHYVTTRYLKLATLELIKTIARPALAGMLMTALLSYFSGTIMSTHTLFTLTTTILLGIVIYVVTICLLWIVCKKPDGIEMHVITKAQSMLR